MVFLLTIALAKDWEGVAIEDADRLRHSVPHLFTRLIHQRTTLKYAELDKCVSFLLVSWFITEHVF